MRIYILVACVSIFSTSIFSQNIPLPALGEAFSNTFNLYNSNISGTCFIIKEDHQQYLITAAHLFDASYESGDTVSIQLLIEDRLKLFRGKIYFHENRKVDIALLKLSENISQKVQLPDEIKQYKDTLQRVFSGNGISMDSLPANVDMDVLFLGYPLGNLGTKAFGIKFLLAKKAIISGWVQHNDVELLLLDGHNNLGFSGGPVIAYDTAGKRMCVVGVISGYIPESVDVKHKNESFSVNQNSGIIVCYGRKYIEDILDENKKDFR